MAFRPPKQDPTSRALAALQRAEKMLKDSAKGKVRSSEVAEGLKFIVGELQAGFGPAVASGLTAPTILTAGHGAAARGSSSRINWSDEQVTAINKAMERGSFKICAFAGTAKTTTLEGVADALGGRGLYLAFNAETQKEAQRRFPAHVMCRTFHSVALRGVSGRLREAKPIGMPTASDIIRVFDLAGDRAAVRATIIRDTFNNYCRSTDERVLLHHVPLLTRELIRSHHLASGINLDLVDERVACDLQQITRDAMDLWDLSTAPVDNGIPLAHDAYLRLFSEHAPKLDFDYIMLDEAQDATPIMMGILKNQKSQLICTGDVHQEIYGWRGCYRSLELLDLPELALTRSFRFGPEIADVANALLRRAGESRRIVGVSADRGSVGEVDTAQPYTILGRTNAALCMEAVNLCGKTPTAIVGGAKAIQATLQSAIALWRGQPEKVTHPTIRLFDSFEAMEVFAKETRDPEVGMLVRLIRDNADKVDSIALSLMERLVPESAAHVVLSTVHKAKGREWNQVILADDFPSLDAPASRMLNPTEERNIMIVAATRAKRALQPNESLQEVIAPGASFTPRKHPLSASEAALPVASPQAYSELVNSHLASNGLLLEFGS